MLRRSTPPGTGHRAKRKGRSCRPREGPSWRPPAPKPIPKGEWRSRAFRRDEGFVPLGGGQDTAIRRKSGVISVDTRPNGPAYLLARGDVRDAECLLHPTSSFPCHQENMRSTRKSRHDESPWLPRCETDDGSPAAPPRSKAPARDRAQHRRYTQKQGLTVTGEGHPMHGLSERGEDSELAAGTRVPLANRAVLTRREDSPIGW